MVLPVVTGSDDGNANRHGRASLQKKAQSPAGPIPTGGVHASGKGMLRDDFTQTAEVSLRCRFQNPQ
jgi:hypothetical protein